MQQRAREGAFWRPQDTSALGGAATNESLLRLFPERAFFCFEASPSALHFPLTNHSLPSTCSAACVLDSCRIPSNGYHHCSCIRFSRASSTPSLSSLTSLQFKIFQPHASPAKLNNSADSEAVSRSVTALLQLAAGGKWRAAGEAAAAAGGHSTSQARSSNSLQFIHQ